jgi:hypothetical protein
VTSATAPLTTAIDNRESTGRYVLLDQLGAGGMGAVYRARDEASGRIVAYKQLLSSKTGTKRRTIEVLFEREYHALVRLRHPRIIEVYDYGFGEAGPYYTMELLDGQDLQQLAPLPYREACRHLRDVASSLALIHAHRLVHRDVSPRNVRLGGDGRAKLIDFGALAAFGPAEHVIGTPLCMAPEIMRRMPLDQRTDLYALGTVAYWVLTGRHAYPARHVSELTALWRQPPIAVSAIVPEVPPALDALVMSLLSLDPLARPASAAGVIDQLTAIAGLEPEEHELAAESYLASGRMVGRTDEQAWVKSRLDRALVGKGAEIVIDGAAGVGKTRLLYELALEAQLKGLVVLKADAQAVPGPFGVASALAIGLVNACPDVARRAAERDLTLLRQLSPELGERLAEGPVTPLALNPAERRARMQTALYEWFLALAKERTLLLAVDNIQAADDNSAAFLAALGHEARDTHLILLVTQRMGDDVAAPGSVRVLRKRGSRLKLAGLSAGPCEELVKTLFGDVANTGRVARLLHQKSAGNPQQCMDLARLLVKKKIAKYAGGTWVLPLEVSSDELPSRVDEIVAIKLAGLSASARGLSEALSIHAKPVSIERCLALAEQTEEREAYNALDELVADQILLLEGSSYRFAQETLRETMLSQMDGRRRRALHMRAAEALLSAAGDDLELRMEGAWHLLRSGDESGAADLLASTGRAFLANRGVSAGEHAEQIVDALSTAVEVYERRGRSKYEIARLLFPLLPFAYYCADWRLLIRYSERALKLGLEITGLDWAWRLRRLLGRKLALKVGLLIAAFAFARQKRRGIDYDLRSALGSFCGAVPAATAIFSTTLDALTVARVVRNLRPLTLFDAHELPSFMHAYAAAALAVTEGREGEARAMYARLIERFDEPQFCKAMGEAHWKALRGGLLFTQGIMHAYCSSSEAVTRAHDMEELGVRTWEMNAAQVRMLHHAFRGEIEQVQRYRDLVELFAVQGNTTWQAEMFLPAVLLNADVLTGDTIAARRTWEQLTRRSKGVPSLRIYADAAHAAYLALRGELGPAIEVYEQVVREIEPRRGVSWLSCRAHFAETLNWAGAHARAKQVVLEALSHLPAIEREVLVLTLEPQRQLALAEAGLGNHAQAVSILDGLLAEHARHDNPLLIGLLHKARAEVAILMRDRAAFEAHLGPMEQFFRSTRNPALIGQWERLCDRARRAGVRVAPEPRTADVTTKAAASMLTQRTLTELSAAADRSKYALQLVMQRSRAKVGYLYVFDNERMLLVAASHPTEPPAEIERQLQERALRAEVEAQECDDATTLELVDTSDDGGSLTQRSGIQPIASARLPMTSALPTSTRPSGFKPAPTADGRDSQHDNAACTVFIPSAPPEPPPGSYRTLLLTMPLEKRRIVVGGMILDVEEYSLFGLDPTLLDGIAKALHERAMTTSIHSVVE